MYADIKTSGLTVNVDGPNGRRRDQPDVERRQAVRRANPVISSFVCSRTIRPSATDSGMHGPSIRHFDAAHRENTTALSVLYC